MFGKLWICLVGAFLTITAVMLAGCQDGEEVGFAPTSTSDATPTPAATPTHTPTPSTRIAFGSNRDGNKEIYVMNLDGTGQTNLTSNQAWDGGTAW